MMVAWVVFLGVAVCFFARFLKSLLRKNRRDLLLRIFLSIRKAAAAQGGKVVIEGLSSEIRQVFMMTGFLQLFEIK